MQQKHHTFLHHDQGTSTNNQASSEAIINNVNNDIKMSWKYPLASNSLNISNHNCIVIVTVLLDLGETSTIICKDIATILGLQGINCELNLSSAISFTKTLPLTINNFQLSSSSHTNPIKLSNVWVVEDLNIPFSKVSISLTKKRLWHIQYLLLSTANNKTSLIIGPDMSEFQIYLEKRHWRLGELIGMGWILFPTQ